jgi:hypothetical protein
MRVLALVALAAAATAGGAVLLRAPSGGAATASRPAGAPATCRHQSSAVFPRSARDRIAGPLVLVGAREYSPPEVIAEFGGQKYPALVLAGHRVTVELPRGVRRSAALLYADDNWSRPDGPRTVKDGHRVVEFRACSARRAAGSYGGRDATFWSGFVLTTVPRCLEMRVWADDELTPRRVRIPLGRRCG